jgi:hypothetical protein
VVACVQEVRVGHDADSFPLQDRGGGPDEVEGSIVVGIGSACWFDLGLFGQGKMLGRMAVIGCAAVADWRLVVTGMKGEVMFEGGLRHGVRQYGLIDQCGLKARVLRSRVVTNRRTGRYVLYVYARTC